MQIINRVGCNFDVNDREELARLGISVSLGIDAFDIEEADPNWTRIRHWIARRLPVTTTRTQFTQAELRDASFQALVPTWHHGYPMPDMDDGYIDITYDTSNGCRTCGVGWKQQSPFHMKGEPKWGKKQILQLNWVFDEYFVTPQVYDQVFKPFGISCREVLHYKRASALTTVVQLVVDSVSAFPLEIRKTPDETCSQCGQEKFHAHTRGFFPKLLGKTNLPIFKTQEYFGSGGSAWRAIIVSHDLYQAMNEYKLKGVGYYPLAD